MSLTVPDDVLISQVLPNTYYYDLKIACITNKQIRADCGNDIMWRYKVEKYFPQQLNFKQVGQTWKEYYKMLAQKPVYYKGDVQFQLVVETDHLDRIRETIDSIYPIPEDATHIVGTTMNSERLVVIDLEDNKIIINNIKNIPITKIIIATLNSPNKKYISDIVGDVRNNLTSPYSSKPIYGFKTADDLYLRLYPKSSTGKFNLVHERLNTSSIQALRKYAEILGIPSKDRDEITLRANVRAELEKIGHIVAIIY